MSRLSCAPPTLATYEVVSQLMGFCGYRSYDTGNTDRGQAPFQADPAVAAGTASMADCPGLDLVGAVHRLPVVTMEARRASAVSQGHAPE
jgi:hypothetical protein